MNNRYTGNNEGCQCEVKPNLSLKVDITSESGVSMKELDFALRFFVYGNPEDVNIHKSQLYQHEGKYYALLNEESFAKGWLFCDVIIAEYASGNPNVSYVTVRCNTGCLVNDCCREAENLTTSGQGYVVKFSKEEVYPYPGYTPEYLTSEELWTSYFRLPQLTADRAIADEQGNRITDTYVRREAVANHIKQIYNQQFLDNPPLITEGYITPEMLSEETKQMLENTGQTITNLPDGEDLQSVHGVLKFADKQYNPNSYSGLGRRILRKNIVAGANILTQSMMQWPNTIYVIQYNYDLQGENITVPENCVLQFEGGKIDNGTIVCTYTKIEGCAFCIGESIFVKGTHNDLDLSWIGVVGNNVSNSRILNGLNRFQTDKYSGGRNFYLSESVVCDDGDVILPEFTNLDGKNHTITFTTSQSEHGLIGLGNFNKLSNIRIRVSNSDFKGTCIFCDSQICNIEIFNIDNVEVQGLWNSSHHYTTHCGLLIKAHNEGDNYNCFTNCRINNLKIYYVNVGINIVCDNSIVRNDNYFAWLNELHIDNLFIQSDNAGIKTKFVDNGINPANSVGPLYVYKYEHQAAHDALAFIHEGNWQMFIDGISQWDTENVGKVLSGFVFLNNLQASTGKDEDGKDTDGDYQTILGVKVYSGKVFLDYKRSNVSYYLSDRGYDSSTGMPNVKVGYENGVFGIAQKGLKKAWFVDNNIEYILLNSKTESYRIVDNRYGVDTVYNISIDPDNHKRYKIYSIERRHPERQSLNVNVQNSTLCEETYRCVYSGSLNGVFKLKIRMLFKHNNTTVNWGVYKSQINRIASLNTIFTDVKINNKDLNNKNITYYTTEEGEDLYLTIIGNTINNLNVLVIYFNINYNNYFVIGEDIVFDAIGQPNLNRTNNDFLYGVEIVKESGLNIKDQGFEYFNPTLNKTLYWTGTKWVDATGAEI